MIPQIFCSVIGEETRLTIERSDWLTQRTITGESKKDVVIVRIRFTALTAPLLKYPDLDNGLLFFNYLLNNFLFSY